ncbi:MAG TPA: hypothetical protein VF772_24320 [Terriglobales bacterium]
MPHDTPAAIAAAREREAAMNGNLVYTPDTVQFAPDPPGKYYIWNLGPMKHVVEKGSAGTFNIEPCAEDGGLGPPLVLPTVWRDTYFIEQEMKTHAVSGEFMAIDIVHPVTAHIGAGKTWWSIGANLDDIGVFWTKNNPPLDAEIEAARKKMEITYRKLLNMAASIEAAGRIDDITPLMRIAASYFGEDRAWNKIYRKTMECPGCGEPAKAGIIRHPCGYIFDPDRALMAGMISEEVHKQMMKYRMAEAGIEEKPKRKK